MEATLTKIGSRVYQNMNNIEAQIRPKLGREEGAEEKQVPSPNLPSQESCNTFKQLLILVDSRCNVGADGILNVGPTSPFSI